MSLQAEPGAGKSTGLPLALLLENRLPGKIILLEPRRLAARLVAERLAAHLKEPVGQRVGLRMRLDTRVSNRTQLEVVTEGVLTRLLQGNPALEGISLIIFDEFHERSLHADLGLALCLEVQQVLREDLRLLLMSATLDSSVLENQLANIGQFECHVRQHPVEKIWLGEQRASLPQQILGAVKQALEDQPGDVLVFLPGVAEIGRTARLLQPHLQSDVALHQLHSGVSHSAQQAATAPAINGQRRIILATSLAETSITIDGVRVVIDSGLERRSRVDAATGAERLETVLASQASATQRAGRAGRTAKGVCYRLWGREGHVRRPTHWQPEIHRADMSPVLLELGLWGASSGQDMPWLEPPPAASVSRAEGLLGRLGLWQNGKLTESGKVVASMPVHPRLGHMLLWSCAHDAQSSASLLAARLDESVRGSTAVDLELDLNSGASKSVRRRADQLLRLVNSISAATSTEGEPMHGAMSVPSQDQSQLKKRQPVNTEPSVSVLLAQAFPDWIAQRRPGDAGRFLLACGIGVVIDPDDALAQCEWLAVATLGGSGSELRIFKALSLDLDELEHYSPEHFSVVDHMDWDVKHQRVLAERRRMLGSLIIETRARQNVSADELVLALLAGIRKSGLTCLPWTENCREWQARVQRMRKLVTPEQVANWPEVEDKKLLDNLEQWLLPWLKDMASLKALQRLDLYGVLNATLNYQQQVLMDEWLPTRYTVPSGSRISLSYCQAGSPVLSVRLQEMLGCTENPSIAQGRIPLKVELLSPARRPVQVTEDLANFWTNSYPAVKKEMAGRYPKHVWPDNPLEAKPTSHAKRRK